MDRSVASFAVLCALASPASAQEGGVVAEFCKDDRRCVDDALEIVFDSGSSTYEGRVEPGVEVPIRVVLDTKSPDIQGYSWAVKHDREVLELIAESVTTAGTIIDPASPDTALGDSFFVVTRAVEGGFFSAVVLSFFDVGTLPIARNVICRAAYRVVAAPECTVIRFVDYQLAPPPSSPSVGINITTSGLSRAPRVLRQGLIRKGNCGETCDDLADNDGDGIVDCDDPDCAADYHCTGQEACDDGIDNNSNGKVDCLDPGCAGFPGCPVEECGDGIDNNGDGAVDCRDQDCRGKDACVEVCDDGLDNDVDSLTDCEDRDCSGVAGCPEFEVCADGRDNDGDGFTDCKDAECSRLWICQVEICADGLDNDWDGTIDCADVDCIQEASCVDRCSDGIDNDGDVFDGFIDCDDWVCRASPGCDGREICDDGVDNNQDSFVDCEDPDCSPQGRCGMFNVDPAELVEVCNDGMDNDADGFVDGLDQDCSLPNDGEAAPPPGPPPPVELLRGDADGSGQLTVLDAVLLIQIVVSGEAPPFDCLAALNTNDDEGVNVADALPIIRWIFLDGPALPGPFPECEVVFAGCNESSPGCR